MSELSISGFQLIKEIGSGGSGTVWLAQSLTGIYRAIKIVRWDQFDESKTYEREFKGIITYEPVSRKQEDLIDILHVGRSEESDFFYYVMELADDRETGRSLNSSDPDTIPELYEPKTLDKEIFDGRPHPQALEITWVIAGALKAIHDKGLVHRDIKPANVVIIDGQPKLADPGAVAKVGSPTMIGSYGYVAPEITFGQPASRQSDIFALGKLYYQLATGLRPERFPELSNNIDVSIIKKINAICDKACALDQEERYSSLDAFIESLNKIVENTKPDLSFGNITRPKPNIETSNIILHIRDSTGHTLLAQELETREYSIGRSDSSDFPIKDSYVSRHHASLYVTPHSVELEDKQSTGGTYIDGLKVSGRVPLKEKHLVEIGGHHIFISQGIPSGASFQRGETVCDERFMLRQLLGEGASAQVWRAYDNDLDEEVALKIFPEGKEGQSEFLTQLRREVKKTRALNHENIVNVYDIHAPKNGVCMLSMEYVEGMSLELYRQTHGPVAWQKLLPLIAQLCKAVDFAHSKKIVHRDIKPANILINRNRDVKLADFGVARTIVTSTFSKQSTRGENTNELAGTMPYMSPQVLMGEPPSSQDDIYAIGVSLYLLLSGFLPFYDDDFQTLTDQICDQPAQPLDKVILNYGINNPIPEHVCAMVMACLSKNPDHRPNRAGLITGDY